MRRLLERVFFLINIAIYLQCWKILITKIIFEFQSFETIDVTIEDPIQPSLQLKFHTEKLSRTIQECNDINTLREIALHLLDLNQKKTAIAQWATRQAAKAEQVGLNSNVVSVDSNEI